MTVLAAAPGASRGLADLPMPLALPVRGRLHRMAPMRLHAVLEGGSRSHGTMSRLRQRRHTALGLMPRPP